MLGIGYLVADAGDSTQQPVNLPTEQQLFLEISDEISTDSSEFESIPGLTGRLCAPRQGVSATVSMELSGGPADVAVLMRDDGRKRTLSPHPVRFDPAGSSRNSFSFTVAHNFGLQEPLRRYAVRWRAVDGPVTAHKASLQILYDARKRGNCLGVR